MAEPTQFDIASAQRIARVVRAVENTPLPTEPLRFRRVLQDSPGKVFRICTFTGAWPVDPEAGSVKVISFAGETNTVSVINHFFPVPNSGSPRYCAIARDKGYWYLIDVPFATATAVFIGASSNQQVVQSISASGSLNSSCQVVIQLTTVTATVSIVSSTYTSTFLRFK